MTKLDAFKTWLTSQRIVWSDVDDWSHPDQANVFVHDGDARRPTRLIKEAALRGLAIDFSDKGMLFREQDP